MPMQKADSVANTQSSGDNNVVVMNLLSKFDIRSENESNALESIVARIRVCNTI